MSVSQLVSVIAFAIAIPVIVVLLVRRPVRGRRWSAGRWVALASLLAAGVLGVLALMLA